MRKLDNSPPKCAFLAKLDSSSSRACLGLYPGWSAQVQFNLLCGPPTNTASTREELRLGPRRITSVSIKTDQYRVTRSRGGGKYPTKSFNTRTTLRHRRQQQPLYCQTNCSVFQHRGGCGATADHTFRVVEWLDNCKLIRL